MKPTPQLREEIERLSKKEFLGGDSTDEFLALIEREKKAAVEQFIERYNKKADTQYPDHYIRAFGEVVVEDMFPTPPHA